jgi:hypothetical protein
MKIWLRGKIYDGGKEPLVVCLTKQDKKNIKNMCKDCTLYCEYPGEKDANKIIELLTELKLMFARGK